MRRARTLCVAAGVGLLMFVLGGGSASAEWFFHLYGGSLPHGTRTHGHD